MSNYIPNHRKKKDGFAKRERELARVLKRGDAEEKVRAAAEEVRAAKLRELRAAGAGSVGGKYEPRKVDAEYEQWAAMPVDEIVRLYRKQISLQTARTGGESSPGGTPSPEAGDR